MRLSELQRKNIINLIDGSFVGRIIDVIIDESGKITDLVLEKNKNKLFFTESNEVLIKFEQIKKWVATLFLLKILILE